MNVLMVPLDDRQTIYSLCNNGGKQLAMVFGNSHLLNDFDVTIYNDKKEKVAILHCTDIGASAPNIAQQGQWEEETFSEPIPGKPEYHIDDLVDTPKIIDAAVRSLRGRLASSGWEPTGPVSFDSLWHNENPFTNRVIREQSNYFFGRLIEVRIKFRRWVATKVESTAKVQINPTLDGKRIMYSLLSNFGYVSASLFGNFHKFDGVSGSTTIYNDKSEVVGIINRIFE